MSISNPAHRASRTSNPPSRPTTPLRPSSRTSLRSPHPPVSGTDPSPLADLEQGFAELADSMADLEANMMHLQLLHESLSRFGENFAAFLYGLNMNAFCVDFPEAPTDESWRRAETRAADNPANDAPGAPSPNRHGLGGGVGYDPETTFMTTDTSFVENPPQSTKSGSRFTTPAATNAASSTKRQPPRPSGIARGSNSAERGGGRIARGSKVVAAGGRGGPSVRGTRASGAARGSTTTRARGSR